MECGVLSATKDSKGDGIACDPPDGGVGGDLGCTTRLTDVTELAPSAPKSNQTGERTNPFRVPKTEF